MIDSAPSGLACTACGEMIPLIIRLDERCSAQYAAFQWKGNQQEKDT